MIHLIESVRAEIGAATDLVGQAEFDRLVNERKHVDWPKRHATDGDEYFSRVVETHLTLVRQELAREILAR